LSTSDTNLQKRRSPSLRCAIVFLCSAAFCVLFDRVYALYAHDVESLSMALMFLYPLLGGTAMYILLWYFDPSGERVRLSRLFRNAYNAGLATLTLASAIQGVLDIAGSSSPYMPIFVIIGAVLCVASFVGYAAGLIRTRAMH